MKSCFNGFFFTAVSALFVILIGFTGCTSVDDTLGLNLLPDDQEVEFHMTVIDGIGSHMAVSDSLPAGRLNALYFGNYNTDGYGRVEARPVLQFVPSGFSEDDFYGNKPYVDSLKLVFDIDNIYGDITAEQKFYIYQLTKKPHYDSTYYYSFDGEAISDMANPLFSFTMTSEDEANSRIVKMLTIEPSGDEYLKKLANLDPAVYEKPDTVFREHFNGWYIAPSSDPSEYPSSGGAIYEINPLTQYDYYSGIYDYFYFLVYGHNHKKDVTGTCIHDGEGYVLKDTIAVSYTFDDSNIFHPNANILTVKHDYSAPSSVVVPALFVDPLTFETVNPPQEDVIYIQGMMGVAGYLDFGGEFLNNLEKLCYNANGEKCIMKVNKAQLFLWLEDDGLTYIRNAPSRLGMFYDYAGYTPVTIPDYSYISEIIYSYTMSYDGRLNHNEGLGYYEMDISSYIMNLANRPESATKQIWVAPVQTYDRIYNNYYYPLDFSPKQVAIQNKWEDPSDPAYAKRIQIKLSYSLLKESQNK